MYKNSTLFKFVSNNRIATAEIQYLSRNQRWQTTEASTTNLKTLDEMPGLSKLPYIGSLHNFIPVIGKIGFKNNTLELMKALEKKFGPIFKFDVFERSTLVVLFNPEDYDKVFRAEEQIPSRPGFESVIYYRSVYRKDVFDGVYGLTTAEGPEWREFRTKVNPALLMPKLIKHYTPGISEVAEDMVKRIKKFHDKKSYINEEFHFEVTKFSLEAIGVIALGTRLGCLEDDLEKDHPAAQLIQSANDVLNLSAQLEFFPGIWKLFPTPTFKKVMKALDIQWKISEGYIKEAKQKIENRTNEIPEEDKSIIERLLAIDEKVAIMMANEMLLAGIDTVAFAVLNILYHLGNNLESQNKLRDEIRSDSQKRSYLRACVKEALRIWPVVPGNLRRTTKEHVVANYIIPKGVEVVSPNEILSKTEKYYPRPLEYIPERWIADKTDPLYYGNAPPTITQPFGFGVRMCIGRRIADLEIETLISKIIDEFEVTWEGPPIKIVTRATNIFVKPYSFRFRSLK